MPLYGRTSADTVVTKFLFCGVRVHVYWLTPERHVDGDTHTHYHICEYNFRCIYTFYSPQTEVRLHTRTFVLVQSMFGYKSVIMTYFEFNLSDNISTRLFLMNGWNPDDHLIYFDDFFNMIYMSQISSCMGTHDSKKHFEYLANSVAGHGRIWIPIISRMFSLNFNHIKFIYMS